MPKQKILFLYNKSNTYGLRKDVEVFQEALKGQGYIFQSYDPLEPPVRCDVAIHLEVPVHGWIPWASVNLLLVNPEWYISAEWDTYLPKFDAVLCKDSKTAAVFEAKNLTKVVNIGWALTPSEKRLSKTAKAEFVWFCAASQNKRALVPLVVDAWSESFPYLTIYSVTPIEGVVEKPNVRLVYKQLVKEEHATLASSFQGHLCLSRAEGFGYTAAEAEQLGAYTIVGSLPCHAEAYAESASVGILELPLEQEDCAYRVRIGGGEGGLTTESLRAGLTNALADFQGWSGAKAVVGEAASKRWTTFVQTIQTTLQTLRPDLSLTDETPQIPPVLLPKECPQISIVTLVHNRPKFVQNACLNLLLTDYPRDKIEWVVVDDSDPDQSASDRIVQFEQTFAPGRVVYVPLPKKTTIGRKRNLGVKRASAEILVMMDDDDHYPLTSLRRRVAWLTRDKQQHECAVCTTIAMYDLQRGLSAVNVPPMNLGLAKRCSEATLTFRRSFWKARPFDETAAHSEGEAFLQGREADVVEMPPQHILVAFSHGTNSSRRSLPDSAGKGCFWGFDKDYLKFIHGLVGVSVEEA